MIKLLRIVLSVLINARVKFPISQVPGQGPTSYLDAAQREKALQQMQQMSSAQIVSATAHMQQRMAPPVTYGAGFWQHPGLGQTSPHHDVKPFAQSPFLQPGDKSPATSLAMTAAGMSALSSSTSSPAWQGRSIGNTKLRLLEFSAYVEQPRDAENFDKHLFVNIGSQTAFTDPMLEVNSLIINWVNFV